MVLSQKFLLKIFLFYIFMSFLSSGAQVYPFDEESEEVIGPQSSYSSLQIDQGISQLNQNGLSL